MNTFWLIIISNALVASVLALVAWLLGRTWRNAAAVHLVWVGVLVKLITPPLITAELPVAVGTPATSAKSISAVRDPEPAPMRDVIPPATVQRAARSAPGAPSLAAGLLRAPSPAARHPEFWSPSAILAAVWIIGAVGLALVASIRIGRFRRVVRGSAPAGPAIEAMVADLAGRLGLRRVPAIVVTSRAVPPLVWSLGPAPRLIVPAELFARLTPAAQQTILAHELAHIRRGDHLIRLLELVTTTLFWWHPVVWIARGPLRELEEECCDGRVLDLFPDQPRTYAVALVDTLEWLTGRTLPPVPLRTAIVSTPSLARRIRMLTQRHPHRLTPWTGPLVAGLLAGPLVLAVAVRAAPADQPVAPVQTPATAAPATLTGRVTDKAGAPLADVRVRVAIPAVDMRQEDPSQPHRIQEGQTDAQGIYRLELAGITEPTTVAIDATKPGYAHLYGTIMGGGDARNVAVEPGKRAESSFSLKPALYMRGIVVDEQGKPVPQVQLTAQLLFKDGMAFVEMNRSQADGSFELFSYPAIPAEMNKGDDKVKAVVAFAEPNHIDFSTQDLYALEPAQRTNLRIVLPTGFKVSGTLLDAAGKPIANTMVQAVLTDKKVTRDGDKTHRKAVLTDPSGRFALTGLSGGPTQLSALSVAINQKVLLPLNLDADQTNLQVRLEPIKLPTNLKRYQVLGMELIDVTAEIAAAYNLYHDQGALILDPGQDHTRLGIGDLAPGFAFWLVGNDKEEKEIHDVRDFVKLVLAEVTTRKADPAVVRVVYNFTLPEMMGTNTQSMKLTPADIEQLKTLADQFPAEPR